MDDSCSASLNRLPCAAPKRRQTSGCLSSWRHATQAYLPFFLGFDPPVRRIRSAVHEVYGACRLYADLSLLPFVLTFPLFFSSDHFNASGVINVVMITMITTAPKVAPS